MKRVTTLASIIFALSTLTVQETNQSIGSLLQLLNSMVCFKSKFEYATDTTIRAFQNYVLGIKGDVTLCEL